jgi:hypothetical protein
MAIMGCYQRCQLAILLPSCACVPPLISAWRALQETKLGQKFVVDATLLTDLSHAGRSDDLHKTVNYAQVYE